MAKSSGFFGLRLRVVSAFLAAFGYQFSSYLEIGAYRSQICAPASAAGTSGSNSKLAFWSSVRRQYRYLEPLVVRMWPTFSFVQFSHSAFLEFCCQRDFGDLVSKTPTKSFLPLAGIPVPCFFNLNINRYA